MMPETPMHYYTYSKTTVICSALVGIILGFLAGSYRSKPVSYDKDISELRGDVTRLTAEVAALRPVPVAYEPVPEPTPTPTISQSTSKRSTPAPTPTEKQRVQSVEERIRILEARAKQMEASRP